MFARAMEKSYEERVKEAEDRKEKKQRQKHGNPDLLPRWLVKTQPTQGVLTQWLAHSRDSRASASMPGADSSSVLVPFPPLLTDAAKLRDVNAFWRAFIRRFELDVETQELYSWVCARYCVPPDLDTNPLYGGMARGHLLPHDVRIARVVFAYERAVLVPKTYFTPLVVEKDAPASLHRDRDAGCVSFWHFRPWKTKCSFAQIASTKGVCTRIASFLSGVDLVHFASSSRRVRDEIHHEDEAFGMHRHIERLIPSMRVASSWIRADVRVLIRELHRSGVRLARLMDVLRDDTQIPVLDTAFQACEFAPREHRALGAVHWILQRIEMDTSTESKLHAFAATHAQMSLLLQAAFALSKRPGKAYRVDASLAVFCTYEPGASLWLIVESGADAVAVDLISGLFYLRSAHSRMSRWVLAICSPLSSCPFPKKSAERKLFTDLRTFILSMSRGIRTGPFVCPVDEAAWRKRYKMRQRVADMRLLPLECVNIRKHKT